jgi:hypothetical protein
MGAPHAAADGRREPGWFGIRLEGHQAAQRAAWCDGPRLTREGDGTTRRCGPVVDQAVLHGLLRRVRALGPTAARGHPG